MTQVVALAINDSLCIAADSRAATKAGPLPNPVTKIRVFDNGVSKIIVAVAGEVLIAREHIFCHIQKFASHIHSLEGLNNFANYLRKLWRRDVCGRRWSKAERRQYMQDPWAKVELFFVPAPRSIHVISGNWKEMNVTTHDLQGRTLATRLKIQVDLLNQCAAKADWSRYLADVFESVSTKTECVGFPVDVAQWNSGNPLISRYATAADLRTADVLG